MPTGMPAAIEPGWSISKSRQMLNSGIVSSRELTRSTIERLESHPSGSAVIASINTDFAIDQAERSDLRRSAGHMIGPLDGIPLAHKDVFFRAGQPCMSGSPSRQDFIARGTAGALLRLDAAGCIDCGRLQMSQLALGATGENPFFGTPVNPVDASAAVGGSSSGSAVIVAEGVIPASLGSDTGGSASTPAACCGVIGFKPSRGAISRKGMLRVAPSLDHPAILARSGR